MVKRSDGAPLPHIHRAARAALALSTGEGHARTRGRHNPRDLLAQASGHYKARAEAREWTELAQVPEWRAGGQRPLQALQPPRALAQRRRAHARRRSVQRVCEDHVAELLPVGLDRLQPLDGAADAAAHQAGEPGHVAAGGGAGGGAGVHAGRPGRRGCRTKLLARTAATAPGRRSAFAPRTRTSTARAPGNPTRPRRAVAGPAALARRLAVVRVPRRRRAQPRAPQAVECSGF